MFGTSGIRGPVGEAVTADLALRVGRALGVETNRVIVGRDPRESGRLLTDTLAAGLRETGTHVLDLGLAATPTVARAVGWHDADAGVSVTASHNPPTDNGLKLWQPSGQAFEADGQQRIESRIESGIDSYASWDTLGNRTQIDDRPDHCRAVVNAVDVDEPLNVIVDIGNGAGGVTLDILDALDCRVRSLNAQPDGGFPGRPSEPTAENCGDLSSLVGTTDADLGIAHDGDADRLQAVASDGTFIPGDVLLAIFALATTESGDAVAVPVDTSLAVEDALEAVGVDTVRTPVGDVYVASATADSQVVFGGEPSGAWIWPDETRCPDGPLAAAKLVELAADRPIKDRAGDIDTYPIRRRSVEAEDKTARMDRIRERIEGSFDSVLTLDGVRVDLGDAWFLVRASGTEPVIRVTAEARTSAKADSVLERALEIVEDAQR